MSTVYHILEGLRYKKCVYILSGSHWSSVPCSVAFSIFTMVARMLRYAVLFSIVALVVIEAVSVDVPPPPKHTGGPGVQILPPRTPAPVAPPAPQHTGGPGIQIQPTRTPALRTRRDDAYQPRIALEDLTPREKRVAQVRHGFGQGHHGGGGGGFGGSQSSASAGSLDISASLNIHGSQSGAQSSGFGGGRGPGGGFGGGHSGAGGFGGGRPGFGHRPGHGGFGGGGGFASASAGGGGFGGGFGR